MLITATAMLAALSLACASTAATVNVERDEFTGQTNVMAEALMPPFGFTVRLITTAEAAHAVGASLSFSRPSEHWRYLRCHSVDMLVDGQPLSLGRAEHDGSVYMGGVGETVSVQLTPDALRRVTTAREVRVRVCNDAWTLSDEMLSALHRVGAQLGFSRAQPTTVSPS